MSGYVVVLTVLLGLANVKQFVVPCQDRLCVEMVRHWASEGGHLDRFRVWKKEDYAPLPTGAQFVHPPIIDEQLT